MSYADALAANSASVNVAPQTNPPRRNQGSENLSIPQDGPLCFAAIKEAPLAEERRLKSVAAWVEDNTTYYHPEQEAKARADADAIGTEQVRVLEEVRREEATVAATVAARGGGLRMQGFEEVEGIAVGGWAGDWGPGRGENARFEGEDATGRRVVGGDRGGVGNESGNASSNPNLNPNPNSDPNPNLNLIWNENWRGRGRGNPRGGRPTVRGGRGNVTRSTC